MSGKRRDEAAEMYQQPGVTKIKRPAVRSLADEGRIDLKRVRLLLWNVKGGIDMPNLYPYRQLYLIGVRLRAWNRVMRTVGVNWSILHAFATQRRHVA